MNLSQGAELWIGPQLCARLRAAGLEPEHQVDDILRVHGAYAATLAPGQNPVSQSWCVLPDDSGLEILTVTRWTPDGTALRTIMGLATEWPALTGEAPPRAPRRELAR